MTAAGTWTGLVGSQSLTLTLLETAGVVTGTGVLTATATGNRALAITGTFTGSSVNLTMATASLQPIVFSGTVSLSAMAGALTGSGFSGAIVTLQNTVN